MELRLREADDLLVISPLEDPAWLRWPRTGLSPEPGTEVKVISSLTAALSDGPG